MTTATQVNCACPNCVCTMDIKAAIKNEDKYYCSEACANGHQEGKSCENSGCGCGLVD